VVNLWWIAGDNVVFGWWFFFSRKPATFLNYSCGRFGWWERFIKVEWTPAEANADSLRE
jgi:hypothetical protein